MKERFKSKKIIKYLFAIFIIVIIAVAGFYLKIQADIHKLSKSVVVDDVVIQSGRTEEVEVEKGEPLNILLLGTDSNNLERTESNGYVSRSDTMMVVSINPALKSTQMLSIPRDTMTYIAGMDEPDKINHAFAYGGAKMAVETVQNFLNIPIDYYAVLDMSGLEQLIDAIDGITVKSPLTFTYRGTQFKKGETREVNGVKAMNFARMRYDDPEGEMGRQNRQKIVIKAIIDKLLSVNAVTYYPKILEVVADNISTNFDLTKLLSIYPKYLSALSSMTALKFDELLPVYLNEVFYFNIPVSSRLKIANELRQHSQLPLISQYTLKDPFENSEQQPLNVKSIIVNQYPSGLSDEQLAALQQAQSAVQSIRELEYEYVEPEYYYPVPPTSVVPNAPVAPPVTENNTVPTEPIVTEAPIVTESINEPIVTEAVPVETFEEYIPPVEQPEIVPTVPEESEQY